MSSPTHDPSRHPTPLRPLNEATVLSVVLPMHNEAENIDALFARLQPVLERLGVPYEVVCVDDGSRDDTWPRLVAAHTNNPRIRLVRFSRNFGKEMAMTAGLRHASGRAVVLMDSDLQHPPEVIEEFYAQWQAGAQVVYGVRRSRDTDPPLRRFLTRRFYRMLDSMSEVPLPRDAGDFRLMDRAVVDALNLMAERTRFMKGLYSWVGFRQVALPFETAPRHAGTTTFSTWKLFRFALDGIVSFSTLPLRVWSWLGLAVAAIAVIYGAVIVLKTVLFGVDLPGYASLMVATLFLGGVQLICLGVLGDYLGRVFTEVKGRPLYLVADSVGFATGTAVEDGRTDHRHAAAAPPAALPDRRSSGLT
ncbi:glycosyltransferase [Niveispirillum lacus]|uniref:Glycosyltransferase n=1 Tax=Niveispirillum lacus TaxID=1981099 RepID=A0A255YU53_9PROT|nr:glycosyltransferase family 2 protein [Niveispirillum lacus]OYQ32753.1 glycosyltransferase [Niveispirillum lacus]